MEKISSSGAQLNERITTSSEKLRAELVEKIANSKVDVIKWMFIFWIGNVITIIGGIIGILKIANKALLLKKLDDLPGSHGGIVNKFGELYVKSGEVPYSIGRNLHNALLLRNRAKYKWETKISQNEYEEVHSLVKELTKIAEKLLS